jgi:DNA-binding cell septation regulator SpoVG
MDKQQITVELRLFESGSLKAYADVTLPSELGEITVKGFRVIAKDGNAPWVAFPTNSFTKDGKFVDRPLLEVGRTLKRQIAEEVLAEFEGAGTKA